MQPVPKTQYQIQKWLQRVYRGAMKSPWWHTVLSSITKKCKAPGGSGAGDSQSLGQCGWWHCVGFWAVGYLEPYGVSACCVRDPLTHETGDSTHDHISFPVGTPPSLQLSPYQWIVQGSVQRKYYCTQSHSQSLWRWQMPMHMSMMIMWLQEENTKHTSKQLTQKIVQCCATIVRNDLVDDMQCSACSLTSQLTFQYWSSSLCMCATGRFVKTD